MKEWMLMTLKVLRLFPAETNELLALVQIMLHDFLIIVLKLSNKKSTQNS